jgi:hypothetical protein
VKRPGRFRCSPAGFAAAGSDTAPASGTALGSRRALEPERFFFVSKPSTFGKVSETRIGSFVAGKTTRASHEGFWQPGYLSQRIRVWVRRLHASTALITAGGRCSKSCPTTEEVIVDKPGDLEGARQTFHNSEVLEQSPSARVFVPDPFVPALHTVGNPSTWICKRCAVTEVYLLLTHRSVVAIPPDVIARTARRFTSSRGHLLSFLAATAQIRILYFLVGVSAIQSA